jgi:hypothetical protein
MAGGVRGDVPSGVTYSIYMKLASEAGWLSGNSATFVCLEGDFFVFRCCVCALVFRRIFGLWLFFFKFFFLFFCHLLVSGTVVRHLGL